MQRILTHLRKHGLQLDAEIAVATGIDLDEVRLCLAGMAQRGEIITCHSTRVVDGEKIAGILCRITGFVSAETAVRRPKPRPKVRSPRKA